MSITCQLCGFVNVDEARFCSGCGSHLRAQEVPTAGELDPGVTQALSPVTDDEPPEAAAPSGRVGAELMVMAGHRQGTRWPVGGWKVTVGRHPDSDVFLDDITVSRRHVELRAKPGGYELHDVGSLNGTYLNDVRIAEPQDLNHGDQLRVGKFQLMYINPAEAT